MKIHFVRHGQTDFNADKVIKPGYANHDLNQTGIRQAREVRDKLQNENFDLIISSPLRRAKTTAEIINELYDLPIIFDDRLREREFGKVAENGYIADSGIWHQMFDFDDELITEDGERVTDFFHRVYDFLDEIHEKYPDKRILIVSHGGVRHPFHAYFNKLEWKGNMRIERTANAEIIGYDLNEKVEE